MNTVMIIKLNPERLGIEIVDPLERPIQIGTMIHDSIWISEEEIQELECVQEHLEKVIEEETVELNEEITSLWKLLNEKDEAIYKRLQELQELQQEVQAANKEIEELKRANRQLDEDLEYMSSQVRKYKRQAGRTY